MVITQTAIKGVDSKALVTGDPGCSVAGCYAATAHPLTGFRSLIMLCTLAEKGAPSRCSPRVMLELLNGLLRKLGWEQPGIFPGLPSHRPSCHSVLLVPCTQKEKLEKQMTRAACWKTAEGRSYWLPHTYLILFHLHPGPV